MTPETRAALALVAAGLPADQVDRVLALVELTSIDTADTVATKVGELAASLPGLFTPDARPAGAPAPAGLRSVPTETDHERGVRLAREKYGHLAQPITSQLTPAERAQARFDATHRGPGGSAA